MLVNTGFPSRLADRATSLAVPLFDCDCDEGGWEYAVGPDPSRLSASFYEDCDEWDPRCGASLAQYNCVPYSMDAYDLEWFGEYWSYASQMSSSSTCRDYANLLGSIPVSNLAWYSADNGSSDGNSIYNPDTGEMHVSFKEWVAEDDYNAKFLSFHEAIHLYHASNAMSQLSETQIDQMAAACVQSVPEV